MPAIDDVYKIVDQTVGNDSPTYLQGFHFKIWTQEETSGAIAWLGDFASMTLSVRNATESILEVGQRFPTYRDGEYQIAWVLEQNMQDMALLTRVFGVQNATRNQFVGTSPRFQITYDANAQSSYAQTATAMLSEEFAGLTDGTTRLKANAGYNGGGAYDAVNVTGRIELVKCKVDSLTQGVMAGRKTGQVRIEGVSEGWRYYPNNSVQQFKTWTTGLTNRKTTGTRAGVGVTTNSIYDSVIQQAQQ